MYTPQIADGTLPLHAKTLAAAHALLENSPDMADYLTIEPMTCHRLHIRDSQCAGSGATFLLTALISLCTGQLLDMSRAYVLDLANRRAFLAMIAAYLNA